MDPTDSRSDARHRLIPATAADVFAAMSDPQRVARWWGPAGFTNTIHRFEFHPGGQWLLTMHGPDRRDYPNESRFTRVVPGRALEIEHFSDHHFVLAIELEAHEAGTLVRWRQTFDTAEHYRRIAEFVAAANEQNLERLAAEVLAGAGRGFDPAASVQRQLDAYNARDLERFVAEYTDDVVAYRLPGGEPIASGKAAFAEHYRSKRFNLPELHADLVQRMVFGNKVIDQERVHGVGPRPLEVAAIYEVTPRGIARVWFVSGD